MASAKAFCEHHVLAICETNAASASDHRVAPGTESTVSNALNGEVTMIAGEIVT